MNRLDWSELRRYWEGHADLDGALDLEADPDALGNVMWPGQPLWLNAHLARLQEQAYRPLLQLTPAPRQGCRALEVGCGAGRWGRMLHERGYDVVGIDLQEALIDANRKRYPYIRFEQTPVQDFDDGSPFDLVSSVTVIQHNPYEHHAVIAKRLRELLVTGGHALILENVHDVASHVFARDVEGWIKVFTDAGFEAVALRRYDYSPFLRAALGARSAVAKVERRPEGGSDRGPEGRQLTGAKRVVKQAALRTAIALDKPAEKIIGTLRPAVNSLHCGFLFTAV